MKFSENKFLKLFSRCFLGYLKLLNDYGLGRGKPKQAVDPRQAKIEQYKREKTLNEQIKLYEKDAKEDSIDEERARKYWLDNIELYEG